MTGPAPRLTPELLVRAYGLGVFPMAESREATDIRWIDPTRRAHLPLGGFHLSRSLARRLRRSPPRVTLNQAFERVVSACAERPETWINAEIAQVFAQMHRLGLAHSIEVWRGEALVGGIYGLALGAAFFGESMFSRQTDGSKIALAHLVHRLRAGGFTLLDVQFLTPHLASLGAVEISRAGYHRLLRTALAGQGRMEPPGFDASATALVHALGRSQPRTQTS